jgi:sterol 22-desaturase
MSRRSHLPGDKYTIPIIGKFFDSMHPTLEGYQKQWASGPLSALSVFNMFALFCSLIPNPFSPALTSFIVMASANEYARKVMNSPTYAEPCLVYSAKTVLQPDNWYPSLA